MTRIPFLIGPMPNPELTKPKVELRLTLHARRLAAIDRATNANSDGFPDEGRVPAAGLSWPVRASISRRAEKVQACAVKRSVLGPLKPEDRKRLEVVGDGVRLQSIQSEHRADEIAAALHADFPWLARATEVVWQGMRQSVLRQELGLRLPPMLLDGPPGIGKSHFARRLGALVSTPVMTLDATHESASFGLFGGQRGWGNAAPGRLISFILSNAVGNPLVVIDEVEKAGVPKSTKGATFALADALLPMLEPLSAANWTCPYFGVAFDMSWVGWILTTNTFRNLPEPLLSRCPPIRLAAPTHDHLIGFVQRQSGVRGLAAASTDAICAALDRAVATGAPLDLRLVSRMLDRAEELERRPRLH